MWFAFTYSLKEYGSLISDQRINPTNPIYLPSAPPRRLARWLPAKSTLFWKRPLATRRGVTFTADGRMRWSNWRAIRFAIGGDRTLSPPAYGKENLRFRYKSSGEKRQLPRLERFSESEIEQ